MTPTPNTQDGTSEALKPCPFCGGQGKVEHGGPHEPTDWCGGCSACDYYLDFKATRAEAITTWNLRSQDGTSDHRMEPLNSGACRKDGFWLRESRPMR